MRRSDPLPDTTLSALRGIDEALTSGRAGAPDAVERELQEIALVLAADAPEPDPDFARRLGAKVANRFGPRAGRQRAWLAAPPRRAILAAAAGLLVVVAVGGALAALVGRDRHNPPAIQTTVARPAAKGPPAASALSAGRESLAIQGRRRVER